MAFKVEVATQKTIILNFMKPSVPDSTPGTGFPEV
jgi:hypothetical protein